MNVLQVVLNLDYGGVESYVIRISKAMVRAGHHVTVLSQPMTELLQDSGVGLITSPLNSTTLPKLIGEIKDHGFDIINAHNYNRGQASPMFLLSTGPEVSSGASSTTAGAIV